MLTEIIGLLLSVAFGLLGFFFLARFLLQLVHADRYNPLSQAIVRLTDPLLAPIRRLLRPSRSVDAASLLAVIVVQCLYVVTAVSLDGGALPGLPQLLLVAAVRTVDLMLAFYFYALFIAVIASWVAPAGGHPALSLIHQLTEPILAPIRRLLPPAGGIDFSTMVALLILYILRDIVLPRLL
jgi:YggT family protein